MKKERLHMLIESAMLLTLSLVLDVASRMFLPPMTFGGQLTLASMLPLVLISYRYGLRCGLLSGFVFSLLQLAMGLNTVTAAFQPGFFGAGVLLIKAIAMILLDYFAAYTVIGFGGIFRNKIKRPALSLMSGSIVALSMRYAVHIISGYILFSSWAEAFFTQEGFPAWGAVLASSVSPQLLGLLYSVVYNGMYMLPEIVITAVTALLIAKVPGIVIKKD